jgi:proteasome assembly chaperone (PAC2) family protein
MMSFSMNKSIMLTKKPKLNDPCLVAAWPGMGSVAITAVSYLKDQLNAKLLGEVGAGDYFAATGANVTKQVIKAPESPKNQFFYYQSNTTTNDIVFFQGSVQPIPHKEYEFAKQILRIAQSLGVKSVYTAAAAPSDMHFKDTPRVFAAPNDQNLLKKLLEYDVHFMGEGTIAGLNGLLVSVAAEMGMKGICLLGEIPFFTAQIEFPRASLRVLEVMVKLLKINVDMMDLELFAEQKEKEIEPLASLLSKKKSESDASQQDETIVPPQEEKIPRSVRLKIEKLFRQAEFDRTYKSKMKLKEELDKWELFDDYQDRFLDLFRKDGAES